MRAIKSVQKSLATEFYGACSSVRNKGASCKRFDVIKPWFNYKSFRRSQKSKNKSKNKNESADHK